jgi:hypothetical protein
MSVEKLVEHFSALENLRCSGKVEHRLIDILVIAVCAVIACAESWDDIALYGRNKLGWLRSFLSLANGIPSHDTFRALVQRAQRGRSGPIRSGRLCDADGIRASCIHHAVEDGDADGSLGLLARQLSGMEVVAEDALVSRNRGFRLGPLAVVGFPLPAQAALLGKRLDMPVALRRVGG